MLKVLFRLLFFISFFSFFTTANAETEKSFVVDQNLTYVPKPTGQIYVLGENSFLSGDIFFLIAESDGEITITVGLSESYWYSKGIAFQFDGIAFQLNSTAHSGSPLNRLVGGKALSLGTNRLQIAKGLNNLRFLCPLFHPSSGTFNYWLKIEDPNGILSYSTKHAIVTNAGPNGSVSDSHVGVIGSSSTVTASPDLGYIFSHWSGDYNGSSNPVEVEIKNASNTILKANFTQDLSDNDGDGLTNYDETITYATNPNNSDTDGDSLTDKQEIDNFFNATSSDKTVVDAIMKMKGLDGQNTTSITKSEHDAVVEELLANQNATSTHYTEEWFFLPNRGWLFTNRAAYPYFYDSTTSSWMYFQAGSDKPRFYHYGTKQWITVE